MTAPRPKIVVLGMMTKMPAAGVVWQNLHYLLGFERLGFEAWYVEAHARTPTALMQGPDDDSSVLAVRFIEQSLRPVGLERQWAFHARHDDHRCFGLDRDALWQLYRDAAFVVNLHGGTVVTEEQAAGGRLVYLETDPVEVQIQLAQGNAQVVPYLDPHMAFFTFGENYGRPGCTLPVDPRFDFQPTRQPVVLDMWRTDSPPAEVAAFTTIGNWRQPWRDVVYAGERYGWSKHEEFLKVLDLPGRTQVPLELHLASYDAADEELLTRHGWAVRPAGAVSDDPDAYRVFIQSSAGEFTVAKDQNVRFRSGWFSDRSATYLAAGRPVVTQETGFSDVLPTGEGLLGFSTVDEAADALAAIAADPERHRSAALDIARDCFDADRVLTKLLDDLGERPPRARSRAAWRLPFPAGTDLTPRSRRPLVLHPATEFSLLETPVEAHHGAGPTAVSVVVVTYGHLPLTRLCLETLLAGWDGDDLELVVVDNASPDRTPEYLRRLEARNPAVRLILNQENLGFVRGCNQGLAAAAADTVVILNNDTVPPPGAVRRLAAHLDDPAIGLVGPLTNHAPNEARVAVPYRTYGGLMTFASDVATRAGVFDYDVATLFCAATRRDVLDRVGDLDDSFGMGLFDDDDLSQRVRAAGYRVVCAEDVFVHHVGEAAFGDLVPDGTYSAIFEENRRRFEEKWGGAWSGHRRRQDSGYAELVGRIRRTVETSVPVGSELAVVSRGDEELVKLGERVGRHFPATAEGIWSGHHPADGPAAVAALLQARSGGVTHLVIPSTERWWLEHYTELRDHLEHTATRVVDEPDSCLILALGDG